MFARLFADEAALQPQRQATQNGEDPAGVRGITDAATEGVHKELSTFFAAPETRYLGDAHGEEKRAEDRKTAEGNTSGAHTRPLAVAFALSRLSSFRFPVRLLSFPLDATRRIHARCRESGCSCS